VSSVGKKVNSRCGESPGFQKPAFGHGPAEPAGPYVMNISKTVDTIIDLRSRGAAPDERVAEHLRATLEAMGAHVDVQATHFSAFSGSLAMVAALALSVVFLLGVIKRRHRLAFVSAFAVALIIFFEFAIGWHVVSRPIQKRSENVVAHFPVQDAARRVIVGYRRDTIYNADGNRSRPVLGHGFGFPPADDAGDGAARAVAARRALRPI